MDINSSSGSSGYGTPPTVTTYATSNSSGSFIDYPNKGSSSSSGKSDEVVSSFRPTFVKNKKFYACKKCYESRKEVIAISPQDSLIREIMIDGNLEYLVLRKEAMNVRKIGTAKKPIPPPSNSEELFYHSGCNLRCTTCLKKIGWSCTQVDVEAPADNDIKVDTPIIFRSKIVNFDDEGNFIGE